MSKHRHLADDVGQYISINNEVFEEGDRPESFSYCTLLVFVAHASFAWVNRDGIDKYSRNACTAGLAKLMGRARLNDVGTFRKHRRLLEEMGLLEVVPTRSGPNGTRHVEVLAPKEKNWTAVPMAPLEDLALGPIEVAAYIALRSFIPRAEARFEVPHSLAVIAKRAGLSVNTLKKALHGECQWGGLIGKGWVADRSSGEGGAKRSRLFVQYPLEGKSRDQLAEALHDVDGAMWLMDLHGPKKGKSRHDYLATKSGKGAWLQVAFAERLRNVWVRRAQREVGHEPRRIALESKGLLEWIETRMFYWTYIYNEVEQWAEKAFEGPIPEVESVPDWVATPEHALDALLDNLCNVFYAVLAERGKVPSNPPNKVAVELTPERCLKSVEESLDTLCNVVECSANGKTYKGIIDACVRFLATDGEEAFDLWGAVVRQIEAASSAYRSPA